MPPTFFFRAHLSLQRRQNLIQSDVFKSQKACEQLDREKGVAEPEEAWFWPRQPPPPQAEGGEEAAAEEEDEEECEFEPHEQLHMLTQYLRRVLLHPIGFKLNAVIEIGGVLVKIEFIRSVTCYTLRRLFAGVALMATLHLQNS